MTIDKRYSETLIGYIIRNVNQRNIPDAQFRKLKMRTVVLMQHLRLKNHKKCYWFSHLCYSFKFTYTFIFYEHTVALFVISNLIKGTKFKV